MRGYEVETQFYRRHAAAVADSACVPTLLNVETTSSGDAGFGLTLLMTNLQPSYPLEVSRG